ncbi:unnamed protein product [Closterium sp. NIES-54]
MASLRVLSFDSEGRPVAFNTWHDNLQLYLLIDLKDSVSLFDHVSGAAPAPLTTANISTCSPWLSRIVVAALGASAIGTPPGIAPAEALHTFTLDSSASRYFFRDSTTLTPLLAPVPVRLADSSRGTVIARSSTVLPYPEVPSGSLSGLHLPSFSTNLVSTAALRDAMVTTTTPIGQRVSICTCTRTGRHQATFIRRPGLSLYTLATEPPQVAASAQVSASGQVAASCTCRLLSHQNLLWHHRLGHPSLPRLRGMHSRLLVSGLSRSLPPLPPSPAPPCLPCVEGRQRAAPHSSSFPPTTAPLQTLHMDVWGPARVSGQGRKRYFLLVVEDYTWYTTVFRKGEVSAVLIPWIRTVRLHLRERFGQDLPVLRLHSDRGVMELNLWSRVSLPETSPTLRWTGKVGNASVFRDITFDESVPFYRLFPYRSTPPPPPPLFLAPSSPPVDPLPPQGPAPSGVSQVDPLYGTAPVQVAVVSGAAPGAASEGAASGGAVSGGAEPGGARSEGAGSGGARDTEAGGAAAPTGAVETGGVGCARAGDPTEPGAACTVGAGAGVVGVGSPSVGGTGAAGAGVGGTRAGGAGAAGAGAVDPGAGGTGDTVWPRPYFVPLLQQVFGVPSTGLPPPFLCPPPDQSQPPLQPVSPLPAPSPYTENSGGLTEHREPTSCPVLPVCSASCAPRSRPPPVPGTHAMALRPSSVPLRVPLPPLPESSLPKVPDPESDRARAASPTVARLLATVVTNPYFESAGTSARVAELIDFAAACRLDYATALVVESVSASAECLAAAAAMDAEMASWKSTRTYVDEVPPPGANIVDGMWIFMVKRPQGSPPAFKARYVARGFSQRQGVDYFQTFFPTPKMTTLRVMLHVAAQRDYELHSLDFTTAFLQGSLHKEIWLRRPPGFIGTFFAGTQWSIRRPVYGLRQAPREWHDTVRTILAALGFAPSTADPSLFLRTSTSLPPFYVLVYVDDLVFAFADTEALTLVKLKLQKRHTCTDLGELRSYLGLHITRDRARRTITPTQSHMVHQALQRFGFQFSLPQLTPLSTSHSLSAPPWRQRNKVGVWGTHSTANWMQRRRRVESQVDCVVGDVTRQGSQMR